jgi:hypothetical protein
MQIQLSVELQEQMERMISQYIEILNNEGIIKKVKENYNNILQKCNINYHLYLINELFTMNKNNTLQIFKKIERNYFVNIEDKLELTKYNQNYDLTEYSKSFTKWSQDRRTVFNDFYYKNEFIYMSAYIFVKKNKSFILTQIENVNINKTDL